MTAPALASPGRTHVIGRELLARPGPGSHIVQFYEEDGFLVRAVGDYLAAGIAAGEVALVIATGGHRHAIAALLRERGIDLGAIRAGGRLIELDADATIAQLRVEGQVDRARFQAVVGGVVETAARLGNVRAYGEMVDQLWRAGAADDVVRLEALWNELARTHRFALLCTYAIGGFDHEHHAGSFEEICRVHTHVLPTERFSGVDDAHDRFREVSLLQQRATALEHEIDRRRRTEGQLLEALRIRDDFLAIAGHELKTPLTALQLQLHSMVRLAGDARGEEALSRLGKAVQHTERLGRLVEELLDVTRLTTGGVELRREEVELAALLERVVRRSEAESERLGGSIRLAGMGPVIGRWDRLRLEQVAGHLISNALKYGRGGPVEVSVGRSAGRAWFSVRDHGMGIADEDQARIFSRFERAASPRHFGGLGLGLWIARQVIVAHGGSIRVESEPGKGATFTVELPCDGEEARR